jgi:autotransporter-associated beta strand protein
LPITKDTGNGTWTLSGANTYTGATIVSAGTLKAGVASTTAPDSGAFGVNSSVTVNALGTLDITGFNTRINALIGTGLVNLGAANLTIGTANANSTYDGTISGTGGSLTKVGTGAQRLGGSNDFSGGTTVTNGDFIITNAAALGSGALTLANTTNQIDCFGLEGGVDLSKAITINLSAQRAGISALTSGDNTLSGPITISGSGPNNTVVIANNVNASTMTLSNTITSSTAGGVLSFRGSGVGSTGLATNTITLPSDANLDLNGTTNWTFSGSGSTWGTTGIYGGGNIVLGANNALSVTAVTGIGGGAGVVDLAGFNQTVGGLSGPVTRIIGNSSTATDSVITIAAASPQSFAGAVADTVGSGTRKVSLVLNGGSQTLTGASTYTGATTLNAGTLTVTGSLGATAVEVKNTGVLAGIGAIGGSVTVRSGGHQQFAVAATAGSQPLRTITGLLTLEANTVIDLTAAVPPAPGGPYILLTATGGISGSVGSVTFSGVSGSVVKNGSNLELTVTASSGYASWIDTLAFGLAPADKDPTDDPDNDGMDNLLEFVLNGNPSISDNSILPKLVVTATDFEFTYQRRDDSVSPETTETFQWGTTLASWPGSAVIPAASALVGAATITVSPGTPNNAVTDTVKISIPKTEAGVTGKLFGRLQVVKP